MQGREVMGQQPQTAQQETVLLVLAAAAVAGLWRGMGSSTVVILVSLELVAGLVFMGKVQTVRGVLEA